MIRIAAVISATFLFPIALFLVPNGFWFPALFLIVLAVTHNWGRTAEEDGIMVLEYYVNAAETDRDEGQYK